MADGFSPGDVWVDELTLTSARGSLSLATSFVSASVYESIFVPGTIADIYVLDTDDQLGELKLVGDEQVAFTFRAPGGTQASYAFSLHEIENIESPTGMMKSKTYMLKCVSEEALHAKTNLVQKSYSMLISAMVEDVHKNFLKSTKPIETEPTKGVQKIVVPTLPPFKAIDMLRRRAVSADNKSSSYVYFETHDGPQQLYMFKTIEYLFRQNPVKVFYQSDAVGHDFSAPIEQNILAYKVPNLASSTDRVRYSGKQRVAKYNFRTQKYEHKDEKTSESSYKSGGSGAYNSAEFLAKFITGAKIPPMSLIPVDTSQRPNTNIPESTADQKAYIAMLMQNAMTIKVIGDAMLAPGQIVECNIPVKSSTTDTKQNDPLLSGNFLISRIHHRIESPVMKPRYTCSMELVKAALEEGV